MADEKISDLTVETSLASGSLIPAVEAGVNVAITSDNLILQTLNTYPWRTELTFSTAAQDSSAYQFYVRPDGTSMYVMGNTNDTVYQYTFGTPGDISTLSYASKSFSVTGQENNPRSLFFKPDGTIMYIAGVTNKTIYQYTLGTAWDVSTASYASKSFSAVTQLPVVVDFLSFNSDGTAMYAARLLNGPLYQYTLSTAWDVSTASYASKSYPASNFPNGMLFNSTAVKLYTTVSGSTSPFREYTLSTAGDLATVGTTYRYIAFGKTDLLTLPGAYFNYIASLSKLIYMGSNLVYSIDVTL
jgi:hypothetical protein